MEISSDFIGGNIFVVGREGDTYFLRPELRDTVGDWFYWAFCVRGAAGRTLCFDFAPKFWLGYFGPAISHDLKTWRFLGAQESRSRFIYTFGPGEDLVYFAHHMLYHPTRFTEFAAAKGIAVETLCRSEAGHDVPLALYGAGDGLILLTARHHACESPGNYVLEGVLDALAEEGIPGFQVAAVPFMDYDGVVQGDQGKNRSPHDHNRDYLPSPLYSAVRALQALTETGRIRFALDFHAPWHLGGSNDQVFMVQKNTEKFADYARFSACFADACRGASFTYTGAYDMPPDTGWNTAGNMVGSFSHFFDRYPGVRLAFTLETSYFGTPEQPVSQENLVELGRRFAAALRMYCKCG